MSDLQTAAAQALDEVGALQSRITEGQAQVTQARGQVRAVNEQCDRIWAAAEDRLLGLKALISGERILLEELGQRELEVLSTTRDHVDATLSPAEAALEGATQETDELRTNVESAEAELARLVADLQAAVQAQVEASRQAQAALEEAAEQERQFVEQEVLPAIRAMQDAVRERAASWRQYILEKCQVAVEAEEIEWSSRLAEAEGLVEDAFDRAAKHAGEVADFVVAQLQEAVNDALGELDETATALTQELEGWRSRTEATRDEIEVVADGLETSVSDALAAVDAATVDMVEIVNLLIDLGFLVL